MASRAFVLSLRCVRQKMRFYFFKMFLLMHMNCSNHTSELCRNYVGVSTFCKSEFTSEFTNLRVGVHVSEHLCFSQLHGNSDVTPPQTPTQVRLKLRVCTSYFRSSFDVIPTQLRHASAIFFGSQEAQKYAHPVYQAMLSLDVFFVRASVSSASVSTRPNSHRSYPFHDINLPDYEPH